MPNVVQLQTNKKGFIAGVKSQISLMKTCDYASCTYVQTVLCNSHTNDAVQETWHIAVTNLSGRTFKTYVVVRCNWKNGKVSDIPYPVQIWNTQKEFIEFLERECVK